jgi:hypothetical protein
MWPNLSAFNASISRAKADGEFIGTRVILPPSTSGAWGNINIDELKKSGFVQESPDSTSFLMSRHSFTVGELKKWFPGFDSSTMIDHIDPVITETIAHSSIVEPLLIATKKTREKKPPKEKIVDAGVKIGRARKDMYSRRIEMSDIADMNESDRVKLITKSQLWTYSFKDAKARGVSVGVADWIKKLRANIPEMGVLDESKVTYEVFSRGMIALRNHIDPVTTPEDLVNALINMQSDPDWIRYIKANNDSSIDSRWYKKNRKFKYMVEFSAAEKDRAIAENKTVTYWVHSYNDFLDTSTDDQVEWWWSHKLNVKTDEQLAERKKERETGPSIPSRPHLDNLKNEWKTEGDVTTQQLMDTFGFRAVEFGEWLPQDERQRVLNEGYSACKALAETVGIPEKMVSFNGVLAVAFGSRGKGKAAAHYESDYKVFNLTRMKGAGSMAHEWAHALDNYLGEHLTGLKNTYLTEVNGNKQFGIGKVLYSMEKTKNAEAWAVNEIALLTRGIIWGASWLRIRENRIPAEQMPEVYRCALDIVLACAGLSTQNAQVNYQSIDLKLSSLHSAESPHKDLYSLLREELNHRFGTCIPVDPKRGEKRYRNFDINLSSSLRAAQRIANHIAHPENASYVADMDTDFFDQAKQLDKKKSKDYYATPKEMFARCFESWVFDSLKKNGMPCDYLVHSVEGDLYADKDRFTGNPYPSGNERESINAAISVFVSHIPYLSSVEALLHEGVQRGDANAVTAAIQNGADVNAPDPGGDTPINVACNKIFDQVVCKLIEAGAIVSTENKLSALTYHPIARVLLNKGCYSGIADTHDANQLFVRAVEKNNVAVAGELIKRGNIDVNATARDGNSLLRSTVIWANGLEMTKLLINAGAEVSDEVISFVESGTVSEKIRDFVKSVAENSLDKRRVRP